MLLSEIDQFRTHQYDGDDSPQALASSPHPPPANGVQTLYSRAGPGICGKGDPEPAPAVQDGAAPLRPTLADPFLPTTSRKQRALPSFKAQARGSQAV